jgi:hypothetical protein
MTGGEVSGFLFAPDREDCLRAISRSLLAVLAIKGVCRKRLARKIHCSKDTIDVGVGEKHLISFETIAALMHEFPGECAPIWALWGRQRPEPTAEDHRAAIEHHTAELVRLTRGAGA